MQINLYNGDCLEVLPTIPDKSIDLVIVDPPYDIETRLIPLGLIIFWEVVKCK